MLNLLNPESLPDKTEFYDVRVYAKGILKRCRKTESKGFYVASVPLSTKDDVDAINALKNMAILVLSGKFKTIAAMGSLSFCYEVINGDFRTSHPFSELNFDVEMVQS